jgi:hypothetical protein
VRGRRVHGAALDLHAAIHQAEQRMRSHAVLRAPHIDLGSRWPGGLPRRNDHYEAATDFLRAMKEIMERRFRWNLRQIIATSEETELSFATAVDAGIGAFSQGESFEPQRVRRCRRDSPASTT